MQYTYENLPSFESPRSVILTKIGSSSLYKGDDRQPAAVPGSGRGSAANLPEPTVHHRLGRQSFPGVYIPFLPHQFIFFRFQGYMILCITITPTPHNAHLPFFPRPPTRQGWGAEDSPVMI